MEKENCIIHSAATDPLCRPIPLADVQTLAMEFAVDEFFGPITRDAVMALCKLVGRHELPVGIPASATKGGTFLVRCGLLYLRWQGTADRLCIPAGGGLRAQVLHDCHDAARAPPPAPSAVPTRRDDRGGLD